MEIRENENEYIITPLSSKLDAYESTRIINLICNESRSLALDLSYVNDCTVEFVENIMKIAKIKEIGIFNIPSDLFVLFNIMNIDKFAKIFVNETDFEENSRQIINRKFSII